jgi:hypothetical protein
VYGGASNPKDCLYATTEVAMHWRVLPSPWTIPIPNLASAPRKASSSLTICPVPRKATESGPCLAWMALKFETKASVAACHDTGSSLPRAFRNSGVVARSSACKGASASQPLGQAMPRFTG